MSDVTPGLYRHYKAKDYEVIGTTLHSETLEEMVIYRALYSGEYPDGQLWVRPKAMFLETIEVDGKAVPRFQKID